MDLFINRIVKTLKSVKLGITILVFILISTLIGSYLPQTGTLPEAQIISRFGDLTYTLFKNLGFFNLFYTWWFITLELLFAVNLTLATIHWLKPTLKYVQTKHYKQNDAIQTLPFWILQHYQNHQDLQEAKSKLLEQLQSTHYKITENNNCYYATKMTWTRFAALYVHIGLLMIVATGLIAALFSYKSFAFITVGDTIPISSTGIQHNKVFFGKIPDWGIKVNKFRIETYPNGAEKQFYSDLSIVDTAQNELIRKEIFVNSPLHYNGITIYQSSYAPTGNIFLKINGQIQKVILDKMIKGQQAGIYTDPIAGKILILNYSTKQVKNILVVWEDAKTKRPQFASLMQDTQIHINGVKFTFYNLEYTTGLSIKSAPEVPLFYLAGLIAIFGVFTAFLSHREIWIAIQQEDGYQIAIGGACNKAKVSFSQEFETILQPLKMLPSSSDSKL